MVDEPRDRTGLGEGDPIDALYAQLSQSAARLMVVHEAGQILRSTHDPEELAHGLLDTIAEALFAVSGCVASVNGDQMRILATRGLEESEVDAIAGNAFEAELWSNVAESEGPLVREDFGVDLSAEVEEEIEPEEEEIAEEEELAIEEEGNGDSAGEERVELVVEEEETVEEESSEAPIFEEEGFEEGFSDEETIEGESEEAAEEAVDGNMPAFELYVPLWLEENVLGILALGPRIDRTPYSADDKDLAYSLGSHLALALHSADLSAQQNRRIEELSVLLRISKEITSTLDLDQVLQTITHMLSLVVPNRRTSVALLLGDDISIRAASDLEFDVKQSENDYLLPALRWAHGARKEIHASRSALENDETAEGRGILLPILTQEGGPSGISILTLKDDQGVLGFLTIESDEDAPPLDERRKELVAILANQTTVAIRNAELYQQTPNIGMLGPMFGKQRKRASGKRGVGRKTAIAAAIAGIGLLVPLPAWVSGSAIVRPASLVSVRAGTEGLVSDVKVAEGQQVKKGAVLAELRKDELEMRLQRVRAEAQQSRAQAQQARSEANLASYQTHQAELARLAEEDRFLEEEILRASLVAPIDGVVLTPRVDLRRGQHLSHGETFVDLADLSTMEVDVHVAEEEIGAVKPGVPARLKVHAYPSRTFRGKVERLSPRAEESGAFRVTIRLENPDGALRPGMTGRAHVQIPPRPFLWSFLRPMIRGIRFRLWM